jgi:hypothetical protein
MRRRNFSVEELRNRIKDNENSLSDTEWDEIKDTMGRGINWAVGVPTNVAKPVADAIYNSPLGERFPFLKFIYEASGKSIDLYSDPEKRKMITEFAELTHILDTSPDLIDFLNKNGYNKILTDLKKFSNESEDLQEKLELINIQSLVTLVKAVEYDSRGDKKKAIETLIEGLIEELPVGFVTDGVEVAKGLKDAKDNHDEVMKDWKDMNILFLKQKEALKAKIRADKHRLFLLTGGREGELNTGPKSPNVFTRIDELLEEINIKLQRVQTNIQV